MININPKLVSIILPTRNRGYCVGQTIDSVLAQTYSNWELIIVDGASTDDTPSITKNYCQQDPRIHYHRSFPRQGLPRDRNIGVSLCQGELVYFIEDDVTIEPDCLETLVDTLVRLSAEGLKVGGIAPRTLTELEKEGKLMHLFRYTGDRERKHMNSPSSLHQWTGIIYENYALDSKEVQETVAAPSWTLFTKDVLEEVGGYEEKAYKKFNYLYEETDLQLRIRKKGYKIYFQPKAIAYHKHAASGGTRRSPINYYYNLLLAHIPFLARNFGWKTLYMYPLYLLSLGYYFVKASLVLLLRGMK